jgi:hypothetical protein
MDQTDKWLYMAKYAGNDLVCGGSLTTFPDPHVHRDGRSAVPMMV